ncbi:MAG TPA: hypothetical protein VGS57_19800 [Thermoanaerobaculia bacterium]|jgi:hypothetical protein|nr:hypothetical protein [Thermoanaerobaculia bacterium]
MTDGAVDLYRRRADPVVAAVFALGLALSLLLALRSQVGGDQLNLLARGWLLLARGEWLPYGNPSSSGGAVPGGVTALLVAAPLALWRHHRAAVLGIVLTQVLAFVLLDRWLREALARRERRLFAVVYWLSPWRLLLSGFLWNPGYLLLLGAIHAWSAWRQREVASWWPSFAVALAVGIGFQIHPSVTLLGAATVLLWITGHTRLRWSGVAAGVLVSAAALVPWVLAVRREPALLPVSEGFPFRGLVLLFPLVRGVLYGLRYGSLGLPAPEARFDFAPELGDAMARPMGLFAHGMVTWFGGITVIVAVLANFWLWRRLRRRGLAELLGVRPGRRAWVAGYARVCFAAALLTYAAAPTTVMWWQGVPLFHAALLPLALWGGALARRRRRAMRIASVAWPACAVVIALLLAFGGRRHRCGGEGSIVLPLRGDHPMLHDLRIFESCPIEIRPDGWWPDVLPEPRLARPGSEAQPPMRSSSTGGTNASRPFASRLDSSRSLPRRDPVAGALCSVAGVTAPGGSTARSCGSTASSVPVASTRPGGAGGMVLTTTVAASPGSGSGGGGGGGSCAATLKLPTSPAASRRSVSVPATAVLKSFMLPSASPRVVTKA